MTCYLLHFLLVLSFLVLPFGSIVEAKYALIVPHSASTEIPYKLDPNLPPSKWHFWQRIHKKIQAHGLTFRLSHLNEFAAPQHLKSQQKNVACIVCCNIPVWIKEWRKKLQTAKKHLHCTLILLAFEPPSILPGMYSKETIRLFDKIVTWNDSLIDNKKFFKFNYFALWPQIQPLVPFSQKKLIVQMSGNKFSSHPDELYSERLKVIQYFEKRGGNEFEFYGPGWEKKGFANYRGTVADKIQTLKNYRFCVCYENIKNIKGYITEKLTDCFIAGSVPIYWGASNITDYIPANCFIAREKFDTMDTL